MKYHSCWTFMTLHQFIALEFNYVLGFGFIWYSQSSIHINCAIYISHTQNNCTIVQLTPCVQPIYWATDTKNSTLTAPHTATFTQIQNINTPNHTMCTAIIIQFRSCKTDTHTRLSQHPSVGPSPRLDTSSGYGCWWRPDIQWLLIYWIKSCGQQTNSLASG